MTVYIVVLFTAYYALFGFAPTTLASPITPTPVTVSVDLVPDSTSPGISDNSQTPAHLFANEVEKSSAAAAVDVKPEAFSEKSLIDDHPYDGSGYLLWCRYRYDPTIPHNFEDHTVPGQHPWMRSLFYVCALCRCFTRTRLSGQKLRHEDIMTCPASDYMGTTLGPNGEELHDYQGHCRARGGCRCIRLWKHYNKRNDHITLSQRMSQILSNIETRGVNTPNIPWDGGAYWHMTDNQGNPDQGAYPGYDKDVEASLYKYDVNDVDRVLKELDLQGIDPRGPMALPVDDRIIKAF